MVISGQVARAEFTLQSSDSSDEDDDDSPPPPYPGLVTSQNVAADDVATDVTSNTIDLNQTNTGTNYVRVDINEEPPNEPLTSVEAPSVQIASEQSSPAADSHEVPSELPSATGSALQGDNSRQRDGVELSQTNGSPEETEMVVII